MSTELGGGGTTTNETVTIAKRGVRNFLIHAGIVAGRLEQAATIRLDMPDDSCYVTSQSHGLVEPCVDLGAKVKKGDALVRVHDIHLTGAPPTEYYAGLDGILAGRHFPGLINHGDFVAVVAVPVEEHNT